MEYKITRSKRKTIALYVHPNGEVEVRCPLHLPKKTVERFVLEKRDWIEKHTAEFSERAALRKTFYILPGDSLLYLGKRYPVLEGGKIKKASFDGEAFWIPQNMEQDDLKRQLIRLYTALAQEELFERTQKFASVMDANFAGVQIHNVKTRWGSCTGKNKIYYAWKLILADERAVDYVVVHELAHTFEHNHSKRFYSIVARYLPDYKECAALLRQLQSSLSLQDWDEIKIR